MLQLFGVEALRLAILRLLAIGLLAVLLRVRLRISLLRNIIALLRVTLGQIILGLLLGLRVIVGFVLRPLLRLLGVNSGQRQGEENQGNRKPGENQGRSGVGGCRVPVRRANTKHRMG